MQHCIFYQKQESGCIQWDNGCNKAVVLFIVAHQNRKMCALIKKISQWRRGMSFDMLYVYMETSAKRWELVCCVLVSRGSKGIHRVILIGRHNKGLLLGYVYLSSHPCCPNGCAGSSKQARFAVRVNSEPCIFRSVRRRGRGRIRWGNRRCTWMRMIGKSKRLLHE